VRAKTGTITGVSSLAGYVLPPGGRPLAFVLYMENFPGSPTPYRAAQDRILAHCIAYATRSGGPTGPPLPSPAPDAPMPTTPR
jgi:D-alanyl-D-alanine carboxypeptidase/D-alanyl-D-alanine-endopeptidase (penicillin-binding protein 4)